MTRMGESMLGLAGVCFKVRTTVTMAGGGFVTKHAIQTESLFRGKLAQRLRLGSGLIPLWQRALCGKEFVLQQRCSRIDAPESQA